MSDVSDRGVLYMRRRTVACSYGRQWKPATRSADWERRNQRGRPHVLIRVRQMIDDVSS